jgi:hypothetical protein
MQTALEFRDDFSRERVRREFLDAVRQAVANISIKELAYKIDISPSLLADALAERANKGVRATWLLDIIELAPIADSIAVMNALGAVRRLEAQPMKELTAEEKAERLEQKLRSLGATGLRLIQEALGER